MRETASKAKKIALRSRNAHYAAPIRENGNSPTGSNSRESNRSRTCLEGEAALPSQFQTQQERPANARKAAETPRRASAAYSDESSFAM
tara:strand:- start:3008 stop:3274 length:267 start_codon:yes stop_codon:yes gene_type:complete